MSDVKSVLALRKHRRYTASMSSRFSLIADMLSPSQLAELRKVQDALRKDPMCLEHHKAHVKDKTRAPTAREDVNVQPK
jgi:hypothetical protein